MTTTAHAAEARWFTDTRMRILVRDAGFSLVEAEALQGNMPPLHTHHDEDEVFYVLEGRMSLFVGPATRIELDAGDAGLAPRGIPHAYRVESERACWLASTNAGGFAAFVEEMSVPAETDGFAPAHVLPMPEALAGSAARQGIEILGPPGALPS